MAKGKGPKKPPSKQRRTSTKKPTPLQGWVKDGRAMRGQRAAAPAKGGAQDGKTAYERVWTVPRDYRGRFLAHAEIDEPALSGAPRLHSAKSQRHDAAKAVQLEVGRLPLPDIVQHYASTRLDKRGWTLYGWRFEGLSGRTLAANLLDRLGVTALRIPELLTSVVAKSPLEDEDGRNLGSASYVDIPPATRQYLVRDWQGRDSGRTLIALAGDDVWFMVYAQTPVPLFGKARSPLAVSEVPRKRRGWTKPAPAKKRAKKKSAKPVGRLTSKRTAGTSRKAKPRKR